jgi:capsid protein
MTKIHPLTGEPKNGKPVNGHPRPELAAYFGGSAPQRQAKLSIDAARRGNDLDSHWQFADALDSDSAYSKAVRHTLIKRSRYEATSNAFYAGIVATHVNMLVGTGPTLRMLTGNRDFNQLVEREFYKWTQAIQFRRKLWAMAHAVTADGETFGILQNNPAIRNGSQLDVLPIEAEQCQTPFEGIDQGHIDGIIYDEFNNVVAYDILPAHPGGQRIVFTNIDPVRVPANQVLHWFKLKRPGAHRGIPALTSGMNSGAYHRRFREATVGAAESAASIGAMLTSTLGPAGDSEPDPVAPFSTVEFVKRMLMVAPMGWDAKQMKGEHPNAQYAEFHRTLVSELARGISMPYNAAACDSSTYSFASGKLDTLCYRAALDVERADCNDLVLDPLFAAWFREWTVIENRRDIPPSHQWDWPTHPVIDAVAEANALSTRLQNGTTQLRQAYSDQGQDYEDQLAIQAEDTFGEATDETIAKCRQINVLKNTPQHAVQYVAQLMGIQAAQPQQARPQPEAISEDD